MALPVRRPDPLPRPAGGYGDLERPPLRAAALTQALVGPTSLWREVRVVAATDSTNADLVRAAASGAGSGLVLVAEEQWAGRGRLDRQWAAPARAALTFSVLLRPDGGTAAPPGTEWGWLPLLAGLAVTDALRRVAGVAAELKWPNDVLVDGRKLAGVLAERVGAAVVLGIGLNVSQTPDELPGPQATSLVLSGARTTDRDPLLRAVLRALETRYVAWRAGAGGSALRAAYAERCTTIGREVRVLLPGSSVLAGSAVGVDDDGALVVRTRGGIRRVAAGDVVHVR